MTKTIKCIIVDDEPVAREILENHLGKLGHIRVLASCKNAMEAFQAVNTQAIDLVFLDINMPEISGLSFARSVSKDLKIIFTTAYRDYAVDGFDLKAVDYLLKPISFERLMQAINKFQEESPAVKREDHVDEKTEINESMFLRSDRKMVKVNFAEILYIESLSDYIKIHMTDQKVLVTRESLSNIEARLPRDNFLRTHRSYIIALAKVDSYTSDTIEMGKYEIPISRSHREVVMQRLGGITS